MAVDFGEAGIGAAVWWDAATIRIDGLYDVVDLGVVDIVGDATEAKVAADRRLGLAFAGLVVALLGVPAVGWSLIRQIGRRQEAEEKLGRAVLDLDATVVDRTQALGERTVDLERRTVELERSNVDLRDFAAAASHDLKEPLRKVTMFGSLLADTYPVGSTLDDQAVSYIEISVNAAERMDQLSKTYSHTPKSRPRRTTRRWSPSMSRLSSATRGSRSAWP